MIRVLIWNEFYHEQFKEKIQKVYPEGIHRALAEFLGREEDISVRTATLYDEHCGITKEILDETDVLLWWGHAKHGEVPDEVAELVRDAVLDGMGAIFLHSAHHSKPFRLLMGTPCHLSWRENGDLERVWVVNPAHPITQGLGRYFELEGEEMYGEPFDKSTIARQVELLEQLGYVNRNASEKDKRVLCVFPTEKMLEVWPRLDEDIQKWENALLQALAPEEKAQLDAILTKINEHMEEVEQR